MNLQARYLYSLKSLVGIRQMALSFHFVVLALALPYFTWYYSPFLEGKENSVSIKVNLYVDPTNYFHYYYSFNYLTQALKLDGMSSSVQSLSRLDFALSVDKVSQYIYIIVVSEHNLEKYAETLEMLESRHNLILWVITPTDMKFNSPPSFALDATASAQTKVSLQEDFRTHILPRILTIYTSLF